MFSGIIQYQAKITAINGGQYTMQRPHDLHLHIGQSIAHDGACMTITAFDQTSYSFFAMQESLNTINFLSKDIGDMFNIEQSITYGERVDGHLVTGHIDCVGHVDAIIDAHDGSKHIQIMYPIDFYNFVIRKGSIAINGTSLTVVQDTSDTKDTKQYGILSVWLIPLTQKLTNLGSLKTGDRVNLEFDMMAKYAHKANTSRSNQ